MEDMSFLQWIFLPIYPFINQPERIAVVAVLFLLGYLALRSSSRFRAWPLLVAAIAWGLWAPWEWHCKEMGYDIRVDLLMLCPALLGVTVSALIGAFRPRPNSAPH
jgi:hypothetical protein